VHRKSNSNQAALLLIASIFLGLFSAALTLSPAVRARTWQVDYKWEHWIGYLAWLAGFWMAHRRVERSLPGINSWLLPAVALINGWGLLSIWRLTPDFGYRQTLWMALGLVVFVFGLRLPSDLDFLCRYKYLWLTSGLLLTALTLVFGTNPLGFGPRLWLGCCGLYFQPSEPLKLLLLVYLSAYFANWSGPLSSQAASLSNTGNRTRLPQFQILVPTLVMTGLALLLLLVQRDLGTAFIFIFIYSIMVFLATGWRWVPLASGAVMAGAILLGYGTFDVIRLRVDAWINPWLDPAGRSYQIVQSLIAVANGGMFGRGPGLGNPTLVPVAHSDFIFTALAEEGGLVNTLGFLIALSILVHCGLRIAQRAANPFRRFLATGIAGFLAAQSILIIGGNLRLLPLTGVTLPFVSYGGSSLLVSFLILLLLSHISASSSDTLPTQVNLDSCLTTQAAIQQFSSFLTLAFMTIALVIGWWAYVRGPDLLTRTDNPRRAIADRSVPRGGLFDRQSEPLVQTSGVPGDLTRVVLYPDLAPIIGYSHPIYGLSGLEASLDPVLRGVNGNDPIAIWWNHILFGQPPPGLDIRLTIDLNLQRLADGLLAGRKGALVLLNAANGEILAISSHPTYDPNNLTDQWDLLIQDPDAPLLNRVTQGDYPTGGLADFPFVQSAAQISFETNSLKLPIADTDFPARSTPLQIALAAATVSNDGRQPAPKIAQMQENPAGGWLMFSVPDETYNILSPELTAYTRQILAIADTQTWQTVSIPAGENLSWFVGGTSQDWSGAPLALTLVLEESNRALVEEIGLQMLSAAMGLP
jgi:cell division protein FtsW (lipid II flippase)